MKILKELFQRQKSEYVLQLEKDLQHAKMQIMALEAVYIIQKSALDAIPKKPTVEIKDNVVAFKKLPLRVIRTNKVI